MGFAGLAGVMGFVAVWFVWAGVVKPIRNLLTATDGYARGDLSYRIPPGAMGELGTLASAMNRMAEELYETQARMGEMNAGLEMLVVQRTQALKDANIGLTTALAAAESANQAKSAFLAGMSHELRTPLNAIIGFAEMMQNEIFGPLGAEQYKNYAQDINVSGVHLLALIQDILDFSNMETGAFVLEKKPVELPAILQECSARFSEKAARGNLSLQVEVEENLPVLHADTARLQQVILKLADNAIKFTPSGAGLD